MKNEISQKQIDFYRENGFVIIENFLNNDELTFWREAVDEAVRKRNGNKLPDRAKVYGEGDDKDADYYDNVFDQLLNLWMDNEKIRKIMLDEHPGKMASTLACVDVICIWHARTIKLSRTRLQPCKCFALEDALYPCYHAVSL